MARNVGNHVGPVMRMFPRPQAAQTRRGFKDGRLKIRVEGDVSICSETRNAAAFCSKSVMTLNWPKYGIDITDDCYTLG